MNKSMYQAKVLDHAKHPRYWKTLEHSSCGANAANPLCGDKLSVTVQLDGEKITDLGFQGEGCAISRAGASMLAESVIGKTRTEVAALTVDDIQKLFGSPVNPARLKCATLGLETLQRALTKPLK